jgi:Mlc titration factor MtfA (ptsG expression regulator)
LILKGTGKSTLYFGAKIYFAVFSDIFFSYPQNLAQQIFTKIYQVIPVL